MLPLSSDTRRRRCYAVTIQTWIWREYASRRKQERAAKGIWPTPAVASLGLARPPPADGVCRPVCALCAPGLVGTQASAAPPRSRDYPCLAKEADEVLADCDARVEQHCWFSRPHEHPGRSNGTALVEAASAFRSGHDRGQFLDECAGQNRDSGAGRSPPSQPALRPYHQTEEEQELSQRACRGIA